LDEKESQELFEEMKKYLSGKVKDVQASKRLKNHPVCLTNEGEISIEMEKVLNSLPHEHKFKAERILEINTNHEVFRALLEAKKHNKDRLRLYTDVLYNQALLIEGLPLDDPVEYANNVCKVMMQA
jgi:molecular chaperone HtpG